MRCSVVSTSLASLSIVAPTDSLSTQSFANSLSYYIHLQELSVLLTGPQTCSEKVFFFFFLIVRNRLKELTVTSEDMPKVPALLLQRQLLENNVWMMNFLLLSLH